MISTDNDNSRLITAAVCLIEALLNNDAQRPHTASPDPNDSHENNQMEVIAMENQSSQSGEWITPDQAAELIGTVTPRTVTKWARQGLIPSVQVNHRWYVHRAKLLEMLNFYQGEK